MDDFRWFRDAIVARLQEAAATARACLGLIEKMESRVLLEQRSPVERPGQPQPGQSGG